MSILTYPLGFIGGGGEIAFYNGVMENSCRFNVADSTYLKRIVPTLDPLLIYSSCSSLVITSNTAARLGTRPWDFWPSEIELSQGIIQP